MNILENFYKKIVRRDLVNKFSYTHLSQIPQLKKIVINLGCKNSDIKSIAPALFSLELITAKPGFLVKSKQSNILLKIRKGNPVGCMVILKKKKMYGFLFKLLAEVFLSFKSFTNLGIIPKTRNKTSFSFTLKDLISFKELKKQFYLFIKLPSLNVTLITNAKTEKELLYLLHSFKLVKSLMILQAIVTQFGRV